MRSYPETYQIYRNYLEKHPLLLQTVLVLNHFITRLMYGMYPLLLIYQLAVTRDGTLTFMFVVIPAISFVMLSLVRSYLNAPRPYEKEGIVPFVDKETKGRSMPSRHVFSATIISMCVLRVHFVFGVLLLGLSLLLAICRVFIGVHYPKDVVVGFFLGCLAGGILFFC